MRLPAAILLLAAQDAAPAPQPAAPPPEKNTVASRVSGSFLHLALDVPGFTTTERNATLLRKIHGDRGVLVGAIPSKLTSIEIIGEREKDSSMTDEKWRDENLLGSGARWNQFSAADAACAEISVMFDGSGSHDFHAFFVRGGYRFDLHVGESLTLERKETITREAFVGILETLRFAVVRRGTWEQMPEAAIDVMDQAIRRKDGWKAWLEERTEAACDDYAVQFAAAEVSRHFEVPPAEQISFYRRTIEILEAKAKALPPKESLSAAETLALAASEDGFALALLDAGETEKAIPHLERALEIAHDLTAPTRGGILYNLACAHARLGHEEIAIERLIKSEMQLPGALARARIDKDFDPIRTSKRFLDLLSGDRGNY